MFFNGINILPAIAIAGLAGLVLVASHFLFSRWKSVVVPTVLFWSQVQSENRRDILFGKFCSLLSLLLLLLIAVLMVFAMMKPGLGRQFISTIVLDVSPATDIDQAKNIASQIINNSDKCNLIIAGKDYNVKANNSDSALAALANIDNLELDTNCLSSIDQALTEAENVSDSSKIYVITGQDITVNDNIEMICLPKVFEMSEISYKVWVPENLTDITDSYFAVDPRYQKCSTKESADIILSNDDIAVLPDWRSPLFVQSIRFILDEKAGLANRTAISKSDISTTQPIVYPDKSSFLNVLYCGIFLLLAFNLYMHKTGRIQ